MKVSQQKLMTKLQILHHEGWQSVSQPNIYLYKSNILIGDTFLVQTIHWSMLHCDTLLLTNNIFLIQAQTGLLWRCLIVLQARWLWHLLAISQLLPASPGCPARFVRNIFSFKMIICTWVSRALIRFEKTSISILGFVEFIIFCHGEKSLSCVQSFTRR